MQNLTMAEASSGLLGRIIASGWPVVCWKTALRVWNEAEEAVKIFKDGEFSSRGSSKGASDSTSLWGELGENCSLR